MKKLGEKIIFNSILVRKSKWDQEKYAFKKEWQPKETKEQVGIVVGLRTIQNGLSHPEEHGYIFSPKEYLKAYLVSYNMKNKPVLVLVNETP